MKTDVKDIIDFIGDKVKFDDFGGTYLWGVTKDNEQMIAEIRGYGAIQNLFKDNFDNVDVEKANQFQDDIGRFIAQAITEKIKREKEKYEENKTT